MEDIPHGFVDFNMCFFFFHMVMPSRKDPGKLGKDGILGTVSSLSGRGKRLRIHHLLKASFGHLIFRSAIVACILSRVLDAKEDLL